MANFHDKEKIQWWGPPLSFDERKSNRKISWLELFYDLVYVACIGQFTFQLAANPTWHTAAYCTLLFGMVFWSWVNGSQYYDLHGGEGIRTRLMTFWQMLAVAAVAITIHDAFEGRHQAFAITFSMIQIMVAYLWWSVGIYDPGHRQFSRFFTVAYVISFGLIIASIFTSHHTATILWIIALLLNLSPPVTGAHTIISRLSEKGQVFTASSSIMERFGSFTIIVLAESILATVSGMAELKDKHLGAWIAFILSILISFLLWSIYFDMTSEQETKKSYAYMHLFNYLHFPLLIALSIVGACTKVLLECLAITTPATVYWMFCLSIATILLMITGLTMIMELEDEDLSYIQPVRRVLAVIIACVLVVPFFAANYTPLGFLGIMALLLFIPVLTGVVKWVQTRFFS